VLPVPILLRRGQLSIFTLNSRANLSLLSAQNVGCASEYRRTSKLLLIRVRGVSTKPGGNVVRI
jgi:hypothetical protein